MRSGENAGQHHPNLAPLQPQVLEIIKEGKCTLWGEQNMALCFASGISVDSLCPSARIRIRGMTTKN